MSHDLQAFVLPAQAPEPYATPTIFAGSCPIPVPELFTPDKIVIGRPVCADTTPLSCQRPATLRTSLFAFAKVGSCQTKAPPKRGVGSNSDGPCSNWWRSGSSQGVA